MYYSRHTIGALTGIVLLAITLLNCVLLLIAHNNIKESKIAIAPVATSTPEMHIPSESTPPVPTSAPRETIAIATSTKPKKVETISKAPQEKMELPIVQSKTATVVNAFPAPVKSQRNAQGFDADDMLRAHNTVREEHNLNPLTWSNALAKSSREWGETLVRRGCDFYHDPDTEYGENLYWQWISDSDNEELISSPEGAVTWWADEIRYYNYAKNTCRKGKDCGHYTQIVWADTTEVGCSVHTCFDPKDDNTQTDLWVCRYDPPGNIEGEKPY